MATTRSRLTMSIEPPFTVTVPTGAAIGVAGLRLMRRRAQHLLWGACPWGRSVVAYSRTRSTGSGICIVAVAVVGCRVWVVGGEPADGVSRTLAFLTLVVLSCLLHVLLVHRLFVLKRHGRGAVGTRYCHFFSVLDCQKQKRRGGKGFR